MKINGTTLIEWTARRREKVPRKLNTYEVGVRYRMIDGTEEYKTVLEHPFAEGAAALGARVLVWAATKRPDRG